MTEPEDTRYTPQATAEEWCYTMLLIMLVWNKN